LNEPVKVSENNLARDFLFLNLENPGFQVSSESPFDDGELSLDQKPPSIPDSVEVLGHFLTVFSPDIRRVIVRPGRNDRIRVQGFTDKSMHFLGIISFVHDIALGFMEFMTFFQKRESMLGIMDSAFRYHEASDNLLIDIDND